MLKLDVYTTLYTQCLVKGGLTLLMLSTTDTMSPEVSTIASVHQFEIWCNHFEIIIGRQHKQV